MDKIQVSKNIRGEVIDVEISGGGLYFVFSSIDNIHELLFKDLNLKKSFINCPFEYGIRINEYLRKNKITNTKVENLKKHFELPSLMIDGYDICGNFLYVILNEFITKDIIIAETTGLSKNSIKYIADFFVMFLSLNEAKTIIFIQNEPVGATYPIFRIVKVGNNEKINLFDRQFIASE